MSKRVMTSTRMVDEMVRRSKESDCPMTKTTATNALKFMTDIIAEALIDGESVRVRRIGTIKPRETKARVMYIPSRNEKVYVGDHRTVSIQISRSFVDAMNET